MHRIKHALLFLLVGALAFLAVLSPGNAELAIAQTDAASSSTDVRMTQNSATTNSVTPNEVNEVAKELWCPLCNGVRLDACELKACEQMRDMIAEQLAEGWNKEQIKNYFIEQYGPQVLGAPPLEGFNWLAWILPFVALAGGGVFLWRTVRRMVTSRPQEAAVAMDGASPSVADEYSRRLEEELKRYG